MQTRTYADLLDRIEALCGQDTFSAPEQARVLSLANARWFRAYRASEYWPRYIAVGQARYVNPTTGAVPFTQGSAVVVSGAGTADVNGIYQPTGTQTSKTLYYLGGDTGSIAIYWTGSAWRIASDASGTIVYYNDDGGTSAWSGTWSASAGDAPAPTVAESARAEIDSFMRLTTAAPYGQTGTDCGRELDFYVTADGAVPLAYTGTAPTQLFVTCKTVWGGPNLSSSTAIPAEFFEYIAHGAYADWLRANGNTEAGAAEDGYAQELLNYELIKSQSRANAQVNNVRYSTYISNQSR